MPRRRAGCRKRWTGWRRRGQRGREDAAFCREQACSTVGGGERGKESMRPVQCAAQPAVPIRACGTLSVAGVGADTPGWDSATPKCGRSAGLIGLAELAQCWTANQHEARSRQARGGTSHGPVVAAGRHWKTMEESVLHWGDGASGNSALTSHSRLTGWGPGSRVRAPQGLFLRTREESRLSSSFLRPSTLLREGIAFLHPP